MLVDRVKNKYQNKRGQNWYTCADHFTKTELSLSAMYLFWTIEGRNCTCLCRRGWNSTRLFDSTHFSGVDHPITQPWQLACLLFLLEYRCVRSTPVELRFNSLRYTKLRLRQDQITSKCRPVGSRAIPVRKQSEGVTSNHHVPAAILEVGYVD